MNSGPGALRYETPTWMQAEVSEVASAVAAELYGPPADQAPQPVVISNPVDVSPPVSEPDEPVPYVVAEPIDTAAHPFVDEPTQEIELFRGSGFTVEDPASDEPLRYRPHDFWSLVAMADSDPPNSTNEQRAAWNVAQQLDAEYWSYDAEQGVEWGPAVHTSLAYRTHLNDLYRLAQTSADHQPIYGDPTDGRRIFSIVSNFPTPEVAQQRFVEDAADRFVDAFPVGQGDDLLFDAACRLASGLSPEAMRLLYGPNIELPDVPDKYTAIEAALRQRNIDVGMEEIKHWEAATLRRYSIDGMMHYLGNTTLPEQRDYPWTDDWVTEVILNAYRHNHPLVLGAIHDDRVVNRPQLDVLRRACILYVQEREELDF